MAPRRGRPTSDRSLALSFQRNIGTRLKQHRRLRQPTKRHKRRRVYAATMSQPCQPVTGPTQSRMFLPQRRTTDSAYSAANLTQWGQRPAVTGPLGNVDDAAWPEGRKGPDR